jgi:HSP20 family protein
MADIVRRRDIGPGVARRGDPFERMIDLFNWDPLREMERALGPLAGGVDFVPSFEVRETHDAYIFKADLPGLTEKDLDIQITGNRLSVSGTRSAEEVQEGDRYYAVERSYGAFTRGFTLPDDTDLEHIEAEMKDGVLNLVIPKKEEMRPKKISVKGLEEGAGRVVEGIKEKVKEKLPEKGSDKTGQVTDQMKS